MEGSTSRPMGVFFRHNVRHPVADDAASAKKPPPDWTRQSAYGHASRLALRPCSLRCRRCGNEQTWMLRPDFPAENTKSLTCWKCGRRALNKSTAKVTR